MVQSTIIAARIKKLQLPCRLVERGVHRSIIVDWKASFLRYFLIYVGKSVLEQLEKII